MSWFHGSIDHKNTAVTTEKWTVIVITTLVQHENDIGESVFMRLLL